MIENYFSFFCTILCKNPFPLLYASCILVRKKLEKRLCLTGTRGLVVIMPKNTPKKARKKPKHSSFLSISTIFSSEWLDSEPPLYCVKQRAAYGWIILVCQPRRLDADSQSVRYNKKYPWRAQCLDSNHYRASSVASFIQKVLVIRIMGNLLADSQSVR